MMGEHHYVNSVFTKSYWVRKKDQEHWDHVVEHQNFTTCYWCHEPMPGQVVAFDVSEGDDIEFINPIQ